MTQSEEIYERFVQYEWREVDEQLKKSIIEAINYALHKPVVGGPASASALEGELLQGEALEKGVSVDSCYCRDLCGYEGECNCSNGMSEDDRA